MAIPPAVEIARSRPADAVSRSGSCLDRAARRLASGAGMARLRAAARRRPATGPPPCAGSCDRRLSAARRGASFVARRSLGDVWPQVERQYRPRRRAQKCRAARARQRIDRAALEPAPRDHRLAANAVWRRQRKAMFFSGWPWNFCAKKSRPADRAARNWPGAAGSTPAPLRPAARPSRHRRQGAATTRRRAPAPSRRPRSAAARPACRTKPRLLVKAAKIVPQARS